MNKIIRLLIADDHQLFRQGVIKLIEDSDGIVVVGEASNGNELTNKYFELFPDVVLTDINMPLKTGPESVRTIKRKDKNAKVLFLSMYTEDEYIYSVLKSGGLGLVSKNIMHGELINAIKEIANGNMYFVGKTEDDLKNILKQYDFLALNETSANLDPLTAKEKEVLTLVGKGLTSEDIAVKLFISKRTVDSHRSKIMDKLNLKSLPDLMKLAVEYAYVNRIQRD